jgi:hypothetical protein
MISKVLEKLDIKDSRSVANLMLNKDLIGRIIMEEPISIPDAIKKYEVTMMFIKELIRNNLISEFYNSKNQGCKKFIFENELVNFIPYYYKKSSFQLDYIKKTIALLCESSEKNLTERESRLLISVVNGYNICKLGEKEDLTRERTRQVIEKAQRRIVGNIRNSKKYEVLKAEVDLLEFEYLDLKQKIKNIRLKNADIISDKISFLDINSKYKRIILIDEDFSVRTINCLKAAEIDNLFELLNFNKNDLMKFRNFGKKSLREIEGYLERNNLQFRN